MTIGSGPEAALSAETASVQARELGIERRLIDEDEPARVSGRLVPPPPGPGRRHVRPVLLGGGRRFFYN